MWIRSLRRQAPNVRLTPQRRFLVRAAGRTAMVVLSLGLLAGSCLGQSKIGGQARLDSWRQHQQLARQSRFKDLTWQVMGPKFAGGRIEAVSAPRGDLGTLYVGVGSGGVWKSINGGLTWKPIFQDQSTYSIGDVVVAPSDPNTVWVATGECHIGRSSYSGNGVYRSTDGGETWEHKGLAESFHIGQVAIDPKDTNIVFVASMGKRRGGGQRGVFRSTDGGETFERVLFENRDTSFVDIVIDPNNGQRVFVSAWDRSRGHKSGVFRSDDGGTTWKRLTKGLPTKDVDRVSIAVATSQPGVVYALMADRSNPDLARRRPAAMLYRSDDGGESWRQTHEGLVPTYVGWDFCDVEVAPDDEERVYVGGFRFLISADGGKTFQGEGGLAFNTSNENVFRLHAHRGKGLHLDVHEIWIDPEHPERVMLGNDGGLFVSQDRGYNWLHLNNLPIAEFYRVHLDDREPFRIWGGTQDNASFVGPATAKFEPGEDDLWKQVFLDPWAGGDGFATFPDPFDPETVFFTQQNGDLKRARFGVLNSGRRIRPRQVTLPEGKVLTQLQFAWDTPFFASVHTETTELYCAAQCVMKSSDSGRTWQAISPVLTAGPLLGLSQSPIDGRRLVAGDAQGRMFFTADAGETWTESKGLPKQRLRDIVASIHDPSTVYVALSGRLDDNIEPYVYRTRDFGKTWQPLANNLPLEPVNALAEDPGNPDLLFLGTDQGVYASIDQGRHWESLNRTLPTAPVVDVAVHGRDGKLVAATHGLSLFLLDIQPIRAASKSSKRAQPRVTNDP